MSASPQSTVDLNTNDKCYNNVIYNNDQTRKVYNMYSTRPENIGCVFTNRFSSWKNCV